MTTPWQRFWFIAEPGASSLLPVRIGLSLIAAWYFASHWIDAGKWFCEGGMLETKRLGEFLDAGDLGDAAKWRLSPLYLTSSMIVLRAYLLCGIALSVAAVMIRGSRLPAVLLWVWCIWLANRSLLIAGPEELALCFGLAYLTIPKPMDIANPSDRGHWTEALTRRLLQVHSVMLLALTGLTMLSSKVWWDGTGSISIAAPIGRRVFDLTNLLTSPWVHESISHGIVFVAIAASILIWIPATRFAAYLSLMIWCVVLALLSSQFMYLATVAILLQCFRPEKRR